MWCRCVLGIYPFSSRTRWSSPRRPMVLYWRRYGRAGGCHIIKYGGVAQLGEHLPCKQGVKSSNLSISIARVFCKIQPQAGLSLKFSFGSKIFIPSVTWVFCENLRRSGFRCGIWIDEQRTLKTAYQTINISSVCCWKTADIDTNIDIRGVIGRKPYNRNKVTNQKLTKDTR